MKYTITICFILAYLSIGNYAFSQKEPPFEAIQKAITTGNEQALAAYFQPDMELNIGHHKGKCNKNQAATLMAKFFEEHPPSKFEYVHKQTSGNNLKYAIGKYESQKGENIVFYLLVSDKNPNHLKLMDVGQED